MSWVLMNFLGEQRNFFHSHVIVVRGDGKRSVLELLEEDHHVVVENGEKRLGMVVSIDALTNTGAKRWRYVEDGRRIPEPAGEHIPLEGSSVVWWFSDRKDPPAVEL